jgi:hypothetical protein
MTIPISIYGVLSECSEILNSMKGQKIVSMKRFSSRSYKEYSDNFDDEYYFLNNEFFARVVDPLTIEIESGAIIGFNGADEENSVWTWVESNEIGETRNESELLVLDKDFVSVDATDK